MPKVTYEFAGPMLTLANLSNGLAWPHDDICHFQSNHGHSMKCGYFRIDAMPLKAVRHLLQGGTLRIVDGRGKPGLTDGLKFGVPTWCLVFNRALCQRDIIVCDWQTREMAKAANDRKHKPLAQTIRKLVKVYNWKKPAVIGDNVLLESIRCYHDDNPRKLAKMLYAGS